MKRCQLWIDAIKSFNMHRFLILHEFFMIPFTSPTLLFITPTPTRARARYILFGTLISVVHAELIGHARGN